MENISPVYMMCYSMIAIFFVLLLSALLLRNTYNEAIDLYENGDDEEDGGWGNLMMDLPDLPLPPGISLPINDWEPEYNKRKEFA